MEFFPVFPVCRFLGALPAIPGTGQSKCRRVVLGAE